MVITKIKTKEWNSKSFFNIDKKMGIKWQPCVGKSEFIKALKEGYIPGKIYIKSYKIGRYIEVDPKLERGYKGIIISILTKQKNLNKYKDRFFSKLNNTEINKYKDRFFDINFTNYCKTLGFHKKENIDSALINGIIPVKFVEKGIMNHTLTSDLYGSVLLGYLSHNIYGKRLSPKIEKIVKAHLRLEQIINNPYELGKFATLPSEKY